MLFKKAYALTQEMLRDSGHNAVPLSNVERGGGIVPLIQPTEQVDPLYQAGHLVPPSALAGHLPAPTEHVLLHDPLKKLDILIHHLYWPDI